MLYLCLQGAFRRLRRHLLDGAFHIDFPAVIQAAQATVFIATQRQQCTAMRTMPVQNPQPTVAVPKGDIFPTQDAQPHRRAIWLCNFFRHANRNPMAAHQLSHRGVIFDPTQQIIFF